jgi:hypothetical protein
MLRQLDPTKRELTDLRCKSAKPQKNDLKTPKTGKLSDGYGLALEANQNGKYWIYAFRIDVKQLKLNLGAYPQIKLAEARQMHEKAWLLVQIGKGPRQATITHI